MVLARERQSRYRTLAQAFSALRTHRDYREFYLKANVKSLRLQRQHRQYTL